MLTEEIPHNSDHAAGISDFFEAHDRLQDPTQRRDYFERLGADDFIDLTQQIAGLVRTGDPDMQHYDGTGIELADHDVPDQREKEQLMRSTWETAREFLADTKLSDEDALDYAALTAAGGLLLAHPFTDGNGRTSRALSYMIARGVDDQGDLRAVLADDGKQAWNTTPQKMVIAPSPITGESQPDQIKWNSYHAPLIPAEDIGRAVTTGGNRDRIIRSFIKQFEDQAKPHIAQHSEQNDDGTSTLHGDALIEDLLNDPEAGMTYARDLSDLRREVRADYVQRWLQTMRLTERFGYTPVNRQLQMPGSSDERKRQHRILSEEVSKRAVDGEMTPADTHVSLHRSHSKLYR
jgi:hypothetical protein